MKYTWEVTGWDATGKKFTIHGGPHDTRQDAANAALAEYDKQAAIHGDHRTLAPVIDHT